MLFYGAGEESARYVPRGLPRDTPHRFPVRESFGFVPGAKARRAATRSRNPSRSTPREVFTSRDGLRRETQSPQSVSAPAEQGEWSVLTIPRFRGLVLPALSGSVSNLGRGGWVKQEKGGESRYRRRRSSFFSRTLKSAGAFYSQSARGRFFSYVLSGRTPRTSLSKVRVPDHSRGPRRPYVWRCIGRSCAPLFFSPSPFAQ